MDELPPWDVSDRRNIDAFIYEYEKHCVACEDEVKVRCFGAFLKDCAQTRYCIWQEQWEGTMTWQKLKEWAFKTWRSRHQHLLDACALASMKYKGDNLADFADDFECASFKLRVKEYPTLMAMGTFLASLDESIRGQVYERPKLPETIGELIHVVRELGWFREERREAERKRKFEAREGVSKKKAKRHYIKDAKAKNLCFKCGKPGHKANKCSD